MFWTLFTVFLSRFGAFLTSLFTFAQQFNLHNILSFLHMNHQQIANAINCVHTTHCCFITLSFAYVMSVQINYTCEC